MVTNGNGDKKDHVAILVRHVPRELRDKLKVYCAKRGISMNDCMLALMRRVAGGERLERTSDNVLV